VTPAPPGRRGPDDGITLVEVVVAMSIMSIVMAMFTTAILQMYRSANRNESASTAQSQLHLAFQRLDKEIRYASGLSTPGLVGGDPYVEYLTVNTGTRACTELRLHLATGQLQRRTWTQGVAPQPGGWTALASNLDPGTPFTVTVADPTYNFQRLRLTLSASAGNGNDAVVRQSDVTFTALNTSLATSSATVCAEGRPVP
jgi:type II secretory pathway pseudopilin PulG